jgi:hypothetical protein
MLIRSKDRKVTNAVSPNGKTATLANAFGLPAGKAYACPGATTFCERICYAGKLEKIYSGVKNVLTSNFEQLLYADYLDGIDGMSYLLSQMVREFVADCDRKGAPKSFRIHWDGDFFSRDYAYAWREVIEYYPDVTFWVYTRSFFVTDILAGIPNLTLYLSADRDNRNVANKQAEIYPVHIATVADTFEEARLTTDRKAYACPENGKRIPLISEKGSACIRCGICVDGRGDVLFSVKKR